MIFKLKEKLIYNKDDIRIRKKYAWIPKKLYHDTLCVIWLQTYYVYERYNLYYDQCTITGANYMTAQGTVRCKGNWITLKNTLNKDII